MPLDNPHQYHGAQDLGNFCEVLPLVQLSKHAFLIYVAWNSEGPLTQTIKIKDPGFLSHNYTK